MFSYKTFKALFIGAVLTLMITSHANAAKAPSFALPGSAGGTVLKDNINLDKFKGKVVYVDFWASWCVPCKKSFPWMNQMHQRYGKQGLTIIAINLDEDKTKAAEFLSQVPADFMIAYDAEGKTAEKYDVTVMPSSYLIDSKGEIILAHRGFNSPDKQTMEVIIREHISAK